MIERHPDPNRRAGWLALAVSLALTVTGAASAQNLLVNPSFATNVSSWNFLGAGGTLAWAPVDAGSAGGSALMTNLASGATGTVNLGQCVQVSPSTTYDIGVRVFIPSGQERTGNGYMGAQVFGAPDCTGDQVFAGNPRSTRVTVTDAWTETAVRGVQVPAAGRSMFFFMSLEKQGADGSFRAYFDDAFLESVAPETLTLPASASIHGLNGTFFHSDLWLFNASFQAPLTVVARYYCFTGPSCGQGPATITLAPRESRLFGDAVVALFGAGAAESAGAIELSYEASIAPLVAASRVYTPSLPAPTNGSAVPVLPLTAARTRTLFLGLGSSGNDRSAGFRSNAGAFNPGSVPATVRFALHRGDGTPIGAPLDRTFAAKEAAQINDIFAAVGAPQEVTMNAFLVVTATAPVFPYVTVIDNQSGDSIFAAAADDVAPR